jgi:hypothetical protein
MGWRDAMLAAERSQLLTKEAIDAARQVKVKSLDEVDMAVIAVEVNFVSESPKR